MEINPQLIQRNLTIPLSSELKLITSIINKSKYCSMSFEDTDITIKSIKEGKTNIYVDGILNINCFSSSQMIFVTTQERFHTHLSGESGLFCATKWMHVLRGSSRAEDQKPWCRSWGKKQETFQKF